MCVFSGHYHEGVMGFIQQKKLAEVIAEQLETMLLDGKWLPGQKLPSERDLATQFSVSRPSLREAIQMLVSKGLLYRKQGGGTYVNDELTSQFADPLIELMAARPEGQFDLLEFRHALEGMAAYYAALRGTQADYAELLEAFKRVQQKIQQQDLSGQAAALAEFYLCMAKGSHNIVLIHVMGNLSSLLRDNIEGNLQLLQSDLNACQQINSQRQGILDAIVARNPGDARKASNEHLAFIEQTLLKINSEDSRMQRALRRIEITRNDESQSR